MSQPTIRLKAGKERPVLQGHPWIFSGAIDALDTSLPAGAAVRICASDGTFLARGYVNPKCAITVRVVTLRDEPIDGDFVQHRVEAALALRRAVLPEDTTAFRLLNGEGDGLPGIIADVYAETIVVQCLTAGADMLRNDWMASLQTLLSPQCIFERSAGSVRREEGLASFEGVRAGALPDAGVIIRESGLQFVVDIAHGQKTGFYLDQRDNRRLVRDLAGGRNVLNAFSYSGAFSVYAAAGGANRVVSVDSSLPALDLARRSWLLNPSSVTAEWVSGDVFEYLRDMPEEFGLVVLDPPALVKRRHDLDRGIRAYRDLHVQTLRRLPADTFLFTFSCSQHMSRDLFLKIVHGAAADARREVQVLRHLGAAADHPFSLAHPEGEYLKGLLLHLR